MAENEQEGGSTNDGKRNRSLEALFQVTHSELQNISRQHTPSDAVSASSPTIVSDTEVAIVKEEDTLTRSKSPISEQSVQISVEVVEEAETQAEESEEPDEGGAEQSAGANNQQHVVRLPVSEKGVQKYQLKSSTLEEQGFKLIYTKQTFDQYEPNPISYGSYRPRSFKPQTSPVAAGETAAASTVSTVVPASPTAIPAAVSPQQGAQPRSSGSEVSVNVAHVGRKRKHPSKPGRHICPYCGRGCAKPSVLQKHIRAHTGERPYPCIPCGFSFKTKSNLYKHCKSRAHAIKAGLTPNLEEAHKVDPEANEEEEMLESCDESEMESDSELQEGDLSIEMSESEHRRKRTKKKKVPTATLR